MKHLTGEISLSAVDGAEAGCLCWHRHILSKQVLPRRHVLFNKTSSGKGLSETLNPDNTNWMMLNACRNRGLSYHCEKNHDTGSCYAHKHDKAHKTWMKIESLKDGGWFSFQEFQKIDKRLSVQYRKMNNGNLWKRYRWRRDKNNADLVRQSLGGFDLKGRRFKFQLITLTLLFQKSRSCFRQEKYMSKN